MFRSATRTTLPAIALAGTLVAMSPAAAQPGALDIESEWVFDADAARPGGTIRMALKIVMPGKFHVQSDKPDEDFIPTVLTLTPPDGITVAEIAYPEPEMLEEEMISEKPIPVFAQEFVIGVAFEVGADVAVVESRVGVTGSEEAGPQAAANKANAASGTTLRRDRYLPGIAAVLLVTCRPASRRGAALVPEATLRAGYDKKRGISRLVITRLPTDLIRPLYSRHEHGG